MIEEILKDLFRVEITLPENILKTLNSYIIKTSNRNLIIDTGMNREECLKTSVLGNGSKNAFQVASEMTWDIMYDSWELFPISQKWFATGESIAHLNYIEEKGVVQREEQGGKISFLLK